MKNMLKIAGIIVFTAVIGFFAAGCSLNPDSKKTEDLSVRITNPNGDPVTTAAVGDWLWAYCPQGADTYQWKKDGTAISGKTGSTIHGNQYSRKRSKHRE